MDLTNLIYTLTMPEPGAVIKGSVLIISFVVTTCISIKTIQLTFPGKDGTSNNLLRFETDCDPVIANKANQTYYYISKVKNLVLSKDDAKALANMHNDIGDKIENTISVERDISLIQRISCWNIGISPSDIRATTISRERKWLNWILGEVHITPQLVSPPSANGGNVMIGNMHNQQNIIHLNSSQEFTSVFKELGELKGMLGCLAVDYRGNTERIMLQINKLNQKYLALQATTGQVSNSSSDDTIIEATQDLTLALPEPAQIQANSSLAALPSPYSSSTALTQFNPFNPVSVLNPTNIISAVTSRLSSEGSLTSTRSSLLSPTSDSSRGSRGSRGSICSQASYQSTGKGMPQSYDENLNLNLDLEYTDFVNSPCDMFDSNINYLINAFVQALTLKV